MSSEAYIYRKEAGRAGGPLLFVFHGTGGNENQLVELACEVAPDATIISPRGDVSENGAGRFFRRTGEGVYDMDDLARATAKMAAFVEAQVKAAGAKEVFGLGYSNGANILASVIFAKPDLFDRAVLMHPLIPFEPEIEGSIAGRRIVVTAGRRDPICPPNLTARLDSYLRAAGANVTLEWHEGGHELRPNEIDAAKALFSEHKETVMTGEIKLEESETKGRYSLAGEGGAIAELTFSKLGSDAIIIDHTGVPDAFRGQGVGLKLVSRAVEDARAAGKKIVPLCPFAKAQFDRHREWADVLKS